jgi:hypothetical protein
MMRWDLPVLLEQRNTETHVYTMPLSPSLHPRSHSYVSITMYYLLLFMRGALYVVAMPDHRVHGTQATWLHLPNLKYRDMYKYLN